ncbi:serine hydrolase domain-containing protein [Nocardioides limicola]|uniref:serine hydrolase domain-containing protein n=1 Tax=Nocardioides limicola TaxID=2803368 RepID=UPI00193BDBFF|nr:serine hydrolase domain-containing protein [Nocardioides sp. DJM-14]
MSTMQETLAPLAEFIDDRAARDLFSGVALVGHDGETVFEHAAGMAHRGHRVPVTLDTRFQVASVGKMITATAALSLVEDGTLELHRPLRSLLPEGLLPAGVEERHTLHHLLSHTSGLQNYYDDDDDDGDAFMAALERIPASRARRPHDLLPLIADLPVTSEVGEYLYSDTNFVIVGLLIEELTGRSFADVCVERVLEPAGMTSSGFFDVDLEPPGFGTGYLVTDSPADQWRSNVYGLTASAMPDGGLTSTAADLARFVHALRGGRLVPAATVTDMLTPYAVDGAEGYGYGTEIALDQGTTVHWGHTGNDPGVTAYLAHFVPQDTTVIVVSNQDRGSWAVIQELLGALDLREPRW